MEEKIPNVVHLDDDTYGASPSTYSTHVIPAKFVPLSRPHTRFQREKFVQSIVQPSVQITVLPNVQTDHLYGMYEAYNPDPFSPLFALACISTELMKDVDCENVPAPTWDMSPDRHIPSIDLDLPSREMSPPQESEQPAEPSTPHQLMVDQLNQDLAQLVSQNEEYAKIIASLSQENNFLRLQVKTIEQLNKDIN